MPWWQLKATADANRIENAQYEALPPEACPYDGTPLEIGWTTIAGGGKESARNCPMGDYRWTGGKRLT